MATVSVPAVCGYRLVNDEWTSDFLEFIASLEAARGSELTYGEKESFWLLFQRTGSGGIQVLPINTTAGAASITSGFLIGRSVYLLAGDGFTKTSGFSQPDSEGTISLTDGGSFPGGPVSIFYS
jgi:hypothetical protein